MTNPFEFDFFTKGAIIATLAGALCGLVGVYVILRGMSYIGHGLSHAVFGWAVAGFVAGINFYVAAAVGGVISTMMIARIARRKVIGADAAIGVVTTGLFALGLALVSRSRGFTRSFEAALFGNVLGVTWGDIAVVALTSVGVAAVLFLRYRPLLFSTFDPEVAQISGIRVERVDLLLSVTLAATVVATMQILGVTLVAAALVVPATIARLLTNRFARMLFISTVTGALCGFAGVLASFYMDIASGASVVLAGSLVFVVVYLVRLIPSRASNASSI